MNEIVLIMASIFFVAVFIIVIILYLIQNKKNKNLQKILQNLEIEKNVIDSSPIIPELNKVENLKRNEKLEIMYNDWSNRLDTIKSMQIPKITDMLLDADYALLKMDYKEALYKIAKLEMEIYKVRTNSEFLLNEIKEITNSEERNRTTMTTLKSTYRELYKKFLEIENDCGDINKAISLQFENISKRFEDFEVLMINNEYTEIMTLVKAIKEMLKHMSVVIEEVPSIVLLASKVLPSKMKEIEEIHSYMTRQDYQLDYLNVEYNIEEASTKIEDIMDRASILNLEDSLLELKVLNDYFDSLYIDFEKEKSAKTEYEEGNKIFSVKVKKISKLVSDIYKQLDEIKALYDLSEEDTTILHKIKEELDVLNKDYKTLNNHTSNSVFAYSKIVKEMETLNFRLTATEENLDNYLDTIGSMKDDESRARQQLEEVKSILKDSKTKLRDYNLPVIPKPYYTELEEASEALKEIVKELEKKPITISVLNTRVDTARDLALKLFTKTGNMLKMAKFAEMAIVYGNRYRSTVIDLEKHLTFSEGLYFKGDYQRSLEIVINALNKIEPGIYEKLIELYGEK